jgi:DNA-binding NarL/FixJ family response regulator
MSTPVPTSSLQAPQTRILLVDDSAVVRQGLRTLLGLLEGVEVVGEAADGAEALQRAEVLRPDVILLDLEMPVMDGFSAAHRLKSLLPTCRLVAFSVHASDLDRQRAVEAGVDAYLVKGAPLAVLVEALTSPSGRTATVS